MHYPYAIIRPLLFSLDPEQAHAVALNVLQYLYHYGLLPVPSYHDPLDIMGLHFPNRVGLAAGLDKNAQYLDALSHLGFGHIEVGTVTPKPQPGNASPRLFRLPRAKALINRLGFNNHGVDALIKNVRNSRYLAEKKGILGINIGKNRTTPLEKSIEDYVHCMKKVYAYADYITVNISSPNTPQLRSLASENYLTDLLKSLKKVQKEQNNQLKRYVPLVVKVAPDMTQTQIKTFAQTCLAEGVDGIIATNTTVERPNGIVGQPHAQEEGGLSGQPLLPLSNQCIEWLNESLQDKMPIIGVGGILTPDDAVKKCQAGAHLVQLYTGLIYKGPHLIKQVAYALKHTP